MITKRQIIGTFDTDELPAVLLKVGSNGIDDEQMEKLASTDILKEADIKPEKGHSYVHLITTGADEYYGCFFEGQLVLTENGYRPIEEITEGDLVWTHQNRFKPVTNTFVEPFTGKETRLKIKGMPEVQTSTDNHPFLILKKEFFKRERNKYYKKHITRDSFISKLNVDNAKWTRASDVKKGDYVLIPHGLEKTPPPSDLGLDFAFLAGLYMAEGCLSKRKRGIPVDKDYCRIVFTMNKEVDKEAIDKLKAIIKNMGYSTYTYHPKDAKYVQIQVSHKELANKLLKYVGHGSKNKFIHPLLFNQSEAWRKEFITAYLDGDGHISKNNLIKKYNGAVKYSTVSLKAALDIQRFLATLGVRSSVCKDMNRAAQGTLGKRDSIIYSGSIGQKDVSKLAGFGTRLSYSVPKDVESIPFTGSAGYINRHFSIRKVTKVETEYSIEKTKYNLEVEEDNSFVTYCVSHNSNANGDAYPEDSRKEYFPLTKTARQLDGGLKKYHNTYMEFGGVYHNHNNSKKGFDKQGEVVFEQYNEPMHRGQLIIKIADDLRDEKTGKFVWHDVIEKLANEQPVLFSQGSSVAADTCSVCGNKATKRSEYCDHIKFQKHAFHESGKQVYMINDAPMFHDISVVNKPADRIAHALEKVASGEIVDKSFYENEGIYVPSSLVDKLGTKDEQNRYNLLMKLSEMEKRVPLIADDVKTSLGCANKLRPEEESEIIDKTKDIPVEFLLDKLNKSNMCLTPRTFTIIVLNRNPEEVPGFDSVPELLKNVFTEMREHGDQDEVLSDGSYKPVAPLFVPNAEDRIKSLSGLLSMDPDAVQNRIIKVTLKGEDKKPEKTAAEPTAEAGLIAKEYAKYQLSFLASDKEDNRKELLTVLSNNY